MSAYELASQLETTLRESIPTLNKPVARKVGAVCAALMHARSANTALIGTCLPVALDRPDQQQQYITRLLKTDTFNEAEVWAPFAKMHLTEVAQHGQTVVLSMDQTELTDKHAILMVAVRSNERAVPLAWQVEKGEANIGAEAQIKLLELVKTWLPANIKPILMADRFYPSKQLFNWIIANDWDCRIRLKSDTAINCKDGKVSKVADLSGNTEFYDNAARIFEEDIPLSLGYIHDTTHKDSWAIVMRCKATKATTLDYGCRWSIESMFSDFKSRGFNLAKTQMHYANRLSKLIALIALAMQLCFKNAFKKNFKYQMGGQPQNGCALV